MKIAPSILSADFGNLQKSINLVKDAEWLHIDVMDGHFVPNISIGPVVVKGLRKYTGQVLDTHLMISDPAKYLEDFIKAGSDRITFHIEATNDPIGVINLIRSFGAKVGISIKPNTGVEAIADYISLIDQILVMSVEPGFGGQKFMTNSLNKIQAISALRKKLNKDLLIVVDGGINQETGLLCKEAGANVLVAGSYIFNSDNPNERIRTLR
jgi:ribulose-phosphate 3-epimerase